MVLGWRSQSPIFLEALSQPFFSSVLSGKQGSLDPTPHPALHLLI